MPGFPVNFACIRDGNNPVLGGVQDEQGSVQASYHSWKGMGLQVLQELFFDGKFPTPDGYACLSLFLDLGNLASQEVGDVFGVGRGAYHRHSFYKWQPCGRKQHCRAPQGMSYQKAWGFVVFLQVLRCVLEVFYISREISVAKVAIAFPQTRKIESQHPESFPGKGIPDIAQGCEVLIAGKTMGKQDKTMGFPVGRGNQAAFELLAIPVFKLYALGSHG
jgi:hypothetical protein